MTRCPDTKNKIIFFLKKCDFERPKRYHLLVLHCEGPVVCLQTTNRWSVRSDCGDAEGLKTVREQSKLRGGVTDELRSFFRTDLSEVGPFSPTSTDLSTCEHRRVVSLSKSSYNDLLRNCCVIQISPQPFKQHLLFCLQWACWIHSDEWNL